MDKERLRKDAMEFRRKKIREIMDKKNLSEMELSIIKSWAEIYGRETY